MKLIGYLLIAFGLFALITGGVSYMNREKVLDIGPIEASTENEETIPLSPIVAIGALAGGVALVVAGARTKSRV